MDSERSPQVAGTEGERPTEVAGTPVDVANEPAYDWPVESGDPAREVWYALVTEPERPLALWIRYTLDSTTDGEQGGRVWAAVTDRESTLATPIQTERVEQSAVSVGRRPFELVLSDHGRLSTTVATGRVCSDRGGDQATADRTVSWDLTIEPDTVPFTPLRSRWLTTAAVTLFGTGRHWSANQSMRVTGSLQVDGERIDFEDAAAHQGHTVGRSIATDWQWVHCNSFDGDDLTLEALRTRGRTSLCLRDGASGERYCLNRLHHVVGPWANETSSTDPGEWSFRGRGDGVELTATVSADTAHWQRASYRDPDGSLRYVAHCSLSRLELAYRKTGSREWQTAESDRARAEWGQTSPPVDGDYPPFAV